MKVIVTGVTGMVGKGVLLECLDDSIITEVVSISLLNTPKCGPWAMEMGPIAVEAARKAVSAVLDAPMHMGVDPGHYELHIDASEFV